MRITSRSCSGRLLPARLVTPLIGQLLGALLALGWAMPTHAAPSFDCNKASSTTEKLICDDSALSNLDQSLADAFQGLRQQRTGTSRDRLVADQRAWLADRDRRCGIPASGAEPKLAQRWDWAPCLADRYRERLTQLGVAVPAVERPAGSGDPGFIHPLCLDLATGGRASAGGGDSERPIPILLGACNRGMRHVDVSLGDGGFFASGAYAGSPTWFAYRPIGRLASGETVVDVSWSGGGTGQFSEIDAVRSTTKGGETTISARTLVGGGDRCNGGIDRATMPSDGVIEMSLRATPGDLISAGDSALDVSRYDLAMCAICCAGTMSYRFDVAAGRQTLVSATVSEALSADQNEPASAQACFDRLVGDGNRKLPRTFTASELGQLAQRFRQSCAVSEGQ